MPTSIHRRRRRKRRGYVRPSRAKPKTGWTLRQLAALAGVSLRTVRLYLQLEVLPRPKFEGPATRYQRRELIWLLAIRRLQATDKSPLDKIRSRLSALAAPELEALATKDVPSGPVAQALGLEQAPSAAMPEINRFNDDRRSPFGGSRWVRHELALGLEMNVREDAGPAVLELVREILGVCDLGG